MKLIRAVLGDITRQEVDIIVNAANNSLLGGGGVDGAIHRAAGPQLLIECMRLGGCATGDAKITKGYRLPAKYVIHTVGPVWKGGGSREEEMLESCYRKSLKLAYEYHADSVAFPCISTGVYRFPQEKAAEIAVLVIKESLSAMKDSPDIHFVCFDETNLNIYEKLLKD